MTDADAFLASRDFLLAHRGDYATAVSRLPPGQR